VVLRLSSAGSILGLSARMAGTAFELGVWRIRAPGSAQENRVGSFLVLPRGLTAASSGPSHNSALLRGRAESLRPRRNGRPQRAAAHAGR
jgi:hypothetical protein